MKSEYIYDVIIVGAGPVGLATALGLNQQGLKNILILEQAKAFRQVGQRVDLLPNNLKALKNLDANVYESLKKTIPKTTTLSKWIYKNLHGEEIRSIPLDYETWFQQYGEGRISTTWYDLQTLLRTHLPQEQIRINHRCINLVDELDCIRIDCSSNIEIKNNPYAHWESNTSFNLENIISFSNIQSLRARLVIAADGINSTIREILYQNTIYKDFAKPQYSGFAAIMGITPIPNPLQSELTESFLKDTSLVTITSGKKEEPSLMLFRLPNTSVGYLLHIAVSLQELQDQSGESLKVLASQQLEKANFPQVLRQLINLSSPEKLQQRPYYIHRAMIDQIKPMWSTGRVVIVGDAAHGMPPFMAQGTNQGFEDAAMITTLMGKLATNNQWNDLEVINQAFEQYDRLRRPIMYRIQDATLKRLSYRSNRELEEYNKFVFSRQFE